MTNLNRTRTLVTRTAALMALTVSAFAVSPALAQDSPMRAQGTMASRSVEHRTGVFRGVEVNKGTVVHMVMNGKNVLKLSDDFVIPKAPAPSWQIIDSSGNVFLLNQLTIAGGKTNRQLTLPSYIKDVRKVQIWCSFAEVNLGEASFATPVSMAR